MKFKFIIVGKDDKFSMSDDELNGKAIVNPSVNPSKQDDYISENLEFVRYQNNSESLASIYNKEIKAERENRKHDFLVFLHADVSFDVASLMHHCEECNEKYDVMGLCGCEKVITTQTPLNWFTSSIPAAQYRWGCVTHGELGNKITFFSEDRKEIRDHAVGAIDGLCIIFGRKALDSEMLFDEQFTFNQYDTDISFQTLITYGMKLGVIVEHSLHHHSVGKSITALEFLESEVDFRIKWNLPFPDGSNVKKIHESRTANIK